MNAKGRSALVAIISLMALVSLGAAAEPPSQPEVSVLEVNAPAEKTEGGSLTAAGGGKADNNPAAAGHDALTSDYGAAWVPSDNVGDINLNGVPCEIADAVLFTKYFVYGLSAFHIDLTAQVAETDVNADGQTLSLGDLIHLVRIIE